jgi:hypothetical protein
MPKAISIVNRNSCPRRFPLITSAVKGVAQDLNILDITFSPRDSGRPGELLMVLLRIDSETRGRKLFALPECFQRLRRHCGQG